MSDWTPEVQGSGPHVVACWAEDFSHFVRFGSREVAEGFCRGFSAGAGHYGAGKCRAVLLEPEWLKELKNDSFDDGRDYNELCRYATKVLVGGDLHRTMQMLTVAP